jgi:ABC-type nickel/cobalt efflux system permease component RcnA
LRDGSKASLFRRLVRGPFHKASCVHGQLALGRCVRHATSRWSGFGELARKAPYVPSLLIILVGLYVGYHGWIGLSP